MVRIYYHQNQLAGNALSSRVIDLKKFDEKKKKTEQNLFEIFVAEPV